MPGRRPGNIRSGHRAEALGVYAFTEFCAVARVPLEEDIGWDAVCTILSPELEDARRLWAGASFWVQFKTETVTTDEYDSDGVKWLSSLSLPFFYCTVNQKQQRLRVYATYNAWPALYDLRRKMMMPDRPCGTPMVLGLGSGAVQGGTALGAPILEWCLNQEFAKTAREVIGSWIALAQKQILLAGIGVEVKCKWETNCEPVEEAPFLTSTVSGSDGDTVLLAQLAPHIGTFGLLLASKKGISNDSVSNLLSVMREAGGMDTEVNSVSAFFDKLQKLRAFAKPRPIE